MTLSDLRTLLDYHYWARDRLLDAVQALTRDQFTKDLGSSFRSVRDTLVHLLAAEETWYQRWQGMSPTSMLAPDGFADVASVRQRWREQEARVRAFVEGLGEDGITRVFEYKMLGGQSASTPFWQMLQHVVNHGSYHRGQVTTLLRQLGATPAMGMDMIGFYRLGAPKG